MMEVKNLKDSPYRFFYLLGLSVLSGLLFCATLPVKGIPVVMFVAFIPLLLVEEEIFRNPDHYRKGWFFLFSLITFIIWNTAGSWWLKNATLFGAVAAVLVNTLMMSLVMQLFHGGRKVFRKPGSVWMMFVSFWLGFEFFHHNWDLTYPWFSLGNAFSTWPASVQWYEFTGMPGGTLWILVVNATVFSMVRKRWFDQISFRSMWVHGLIAIGMILLPMIISRTMFYRYESSGEKLNIVLVQPNNDPYEDQYTIGPINAINHFVELAAPLTDKNTDFVVGPESMIQDAIWERHMDQSPSIGRLAQYLDINPHLTVIVGASSFKMLYRDEPLSLSAREADEYFLRFFSNQYNVPRSRLSGYYDAYNVGIAMDTSGIKGLTHKSKLVAGVERMPFKKYFSAWLDDLALDMGGTVGTLALDEERAVFSHGPTGICYGTAICYESVFGEFFGRFVKNGAQVMFIITNDGWWGNTPGHRQHNAFASLRAIETRRDIARSANTGITCFINQKGEILQPTGYWVPGAIAGTVTTNDKITFYVRYGDYLGRIALYMAVMLLVIRLSYRVVPLHRRKSR